MDKWKSSFEAREGEYERAERKQGLEATQLWKEFQ